MAYDIPENPHHHKNQERTGALRDGYEPCAACGRAVNLRKPHWRSLFHYGGYTAVTEEEYESLEHDPEQKGAGMGSAAVGPECRKMLPELQPYLVRNPGWDS